MNTKILRSALLAATTATIGMAVQAADPPPPPTDQVVVPQVDRRGIHVPKFPNSDFEVGLFGGSYSTQNFGSSGVGGIRLGYHITEDFFVEGVYAATKVSDQNFRQILPGGVFPQEKETLSYYNLSIGYNVLPGEIFIGGAHAFASQFYVIAGVGSTKLDVQRRPTFNFGAGYRLFLTDHAALQIDVRDHVFTLDLLGRRQSTQNPELTAGLTAFF
jgi:outer membrane beta-barrel protein